MEDIKAQLKSLYVNELDGTADVTFTIPSYTPVLVAVKKFINADVVLSIKKFRNKRSKDANAYMWVLLQKMADALGTTKDEVYLQMLDKYGVFTFVIVKPHTVDKVLQEWRICRVLGEVTVNEQSGIQIQCYFGSSTYDTKEMSVLIDGIVSECKELEIETATPEEIERMKREWGV